MYISDLMNETKHNFYLKDTKTKNPTPINYQIFINGKRLRKGIGYSIHPELWDSESQRPAESKELIKEWKKEYPNLNIQLKNINTRIFNFEQESESFIQTCITNRIPIDKQALIKHLEENVLKSTITIDIGPKRSNIYIAEKNKSDFNYILDFTKQFVIDITNGKRTIPTGRNIQDRYTEGTIKTYRNFQATWIEFEEEDGSRFKWSDMNREFYDNLITFLNGKDYKKNTIGKIIKLFKVIAQAAVDDSIHQNLEFRKPYFQTLTTKVDNIYLTLEELGYLENIKEFKSGTWEKARDAFLLECYTTLRISDVKRVKKDHFQLTNTGYKLIIFTKKLKEKVIIPLIPKAYAIFEKYNFLPPKIADQTVNKRIKILAKMVGLSTPIEQKVTKGGKTFIQTTPKHDLISTHTGRRTAATLMNHAGIDRFLIMKLTGHTTESNFLKYLCTTKEEAAEMMANNKFFKE